MHHIRFNSLNYQYQKKCEDNSIIIYKKKGNENIINLIILSLPALSCPLKAHKNTQVRMSQPKKT